MTTASSSSGSFISVGKFDQPSQTARIHTQVNGRFVSIIKTGGKLYCIDSTCYHAAGPLGLGDIEEVNNETCIKCPWHSYPVSLKDGSKLYESLVFDVATKKMNNAGWKRKERTQRVHFVEERSDGEIFVKLNLDGKYDSDDYSNSSCMKGDTRGQTKGKDGSAHVFNLGKNNNNVLLASPLDTATLKVSQLQQEGSAGIKLILTRVDGNNKKPKQLAHTSLPMISTMKDLLRTNPIVLIKDNVERFYTPIPPAVMKMKDEENVFILVVRMYDNGKFTGSYLKHAKLQDTIKADLYPYLEKEDTSWKCNELSKLNELLPQQVQQLVLICAGSGITPLLRVLVNTIENTSCGNICMICLDRADETILLRKEVNDYAKANKVKLIRVLTSSKSAVHKEEIVFTNTHLNPILFEEILSTIKFDETMQHASLIVSCAPEQVMQAINGMVEANKKTNKCLCVTYA